MSQIVNTNMSSGNAQRYLSNNQHALTSAMQRLSSGLRINSAADDAAGFSISERFTSQIRGSDQAARNANDGISLAQTAEGDLAQIGTNLQRIRELAVQAANASNSASDRAAINNESTQLIAEIDRVANNSSFNGIKLLDGTFNAQSFQIGANNTANDRITVASVSSARSSALGVGSGSSYSTSLSALTVTTGTALTTGGLVLNGFNVGASSSDGVSSAESDSSAIAKAAAINAVSGSTGITATIDATSLAVTATAVGDDTVGASVNGVLIGNAGAVALSADATVAAAEMTAAINAVSNQTGVTATASGTGYTLSAADGRNITIAATTAGASGLAAATTHSSINLSSPASGGITIGGTLFASIGASIGNTAATATVGAGLSSLDLTTTSGAQTALVSVDAAINNINVSRAALGAYQNRFSSTIASLQTTSENLTASRSRIQDADFAKESANLSRAQVLQQAGTAMLAQANQSAQGVLSLLR